MLTSYYPEMGEAKPAAQIEADLSHYGRHWFVKTPLDLRGRGITLLEIMQAGQLTPAAQHKAGWKKYKVTLAAFDKLCQEYDVSSAAAL